MTLHEITSQLYGLSVGGFFNGQKVSRKWLQNYIPTMLRTCGDSLVMQIALPDGLWFFTIYKFRGGYDYVIPDNRAQESHIKNKLFGGSENDKV